MSVVAQFEEGLGHAASEYKAAFDAARDEPALRAANARYTGPTGVVTKLMKLMPDLPKEQRRELGQRANRLKEEIESELARRLAGLADALRQAELSGPALDVTLPGYGARVGHAHPLTRVKHELLDLFAGLGFDIAEGPEVDLHENNFDRLGFPPDHPATDMQDTFFMQAPPGANPRATLLRTHTSTVQVREMLRRKPPLAVVSAGAVFRRDDDVTHSPMFMQLEGFMVDEGVSFADLKGVLTHFLKRLFGPDVPVRFRPSYFPFVEPGGEVDVGCTICKGLGRIHAPDKGAGDVTSQNATVLEHRPGSDPLVCRVCKGTGFMEILGCGMIHPVVFEQVGYDPERYTGFAFGMGLDRVAMLRYGIAEVGLLYGNDIRFLSQL